VAGGIAAKRRKQTRKEIESKVGRRSFFENFTMATYPFEEQVEMARAFCS
jgi:hypothetical protein